ncbi:thermonuclease family protein [Marinomonas agarivorans]|nr:thermonuclease family protein [Marinomonas agarivorans]
MVIHRKKRHLLALFLCLTCEPLFALCTAEGKLYTAQVKQVIDGDTLILTREDFSQDRRVRLIGVNTPELDHKNGQHEDFAQKAQQRLQSYAGQWVYYQAGPDRRDRYGRYLYYLFDSDRISLASQLLSAGLGYRIAIPPNLRYQPCLQRIEQQAKRKRLGVWQKAQHWQPKAGFAMTDFTIKSVTQNSRGWWLKTNLNLVINLPASYQDQWQAHELYQLEGRQANARGWQYYRKVAEKEWVMLVKHPYDLTFE